MQPIETLSKTVKPIKDIFGFENLAGYPLQLYLISTNFSVEIQYLKVNNFRKTAFKSIKAKLRVN